MTEFISSKFGKPMLVDNDNFLYMEVRQYQDRIYWKCIHAKKYNCKGKATTRHGKVTSQSLHSHPSDLADVRFRRLESQAKARAQENETIPPRTILGDTSRMLACKNQLLPKTDKAFLKLKKMRWALLQTIGKERKFDETEKCLSSVPFNPRQKDDLMMIRSTA